MRNDRRQPGRLRALVLAVLVHAGVVGVVVVGFQFTTTPTAPVAQPIQATLVEDPGKLEAERRRREEARKKAEAEKQQKEDEARKRVEEQKRAEQQKRVEEQRRAEEQKRVAEQKRVEEEARKKAEAEAERQRQAELKRQEEERQKAEAERQRAEAERRKQEEEARRKAAEESLREQLALEEQAREQAREEARLREERDKRFMAAKAQYDQLIRQKVSRNWAQPVGTADGLKCRVRARLLPGGEVVEATVVVPSGNSVFDRSVEAAVRKASPLPIPKDADLFPYFRDIEFNFDPAKDKG